MKVEEWCKIGKDWKHSSHEWCQVDGRWTWQGRAHHWHSRSWIIHHPVS